VSDLLLHKGGQLCTLDELRAVPTPAAEGRWHPVAHATVLDTVTSTLAGAGYTIKSQSLAVARDGKRFFGTLDLTTPLTPDSTVALAVGIRNSTDKSFPLGFCAGARVFVCDNLAFNAELLVKRKHTRLAVGRWNTEIAAAVQKLPSFAEAESARITRLMQTDLTDDQALAFLVRAMEKHVISVPTIPKILAEWRTPTHDYGTGERPTAWKLLNCFTTVLGKERAVKSPNEYAGQTIRLNALLARPEDSDAPVAA
jgi:hypothetical protein